MTVQTLKKPLFPNTGRMWNDTLPDGERGEGEKYPDIKRQERGKLASLIHRPQGKD